MSEERRLLVFTDAYRSPKRVCLLAKIDCQDVPYYHFFLNFIVGHPVENNIKSLRGILKPLYSLDHVSVSSWLVECYVFPMVLFGMEGWTLTQSLENNIEAFEM